MKKQPDKNDHDGEENRDCLVTDKDRSVSREYQHLDDKEKDAEVVRSILRLQNKIQMMLYFSPTLREGMKQNTPDPK
ncbi:MAG TPA: hypothetical protein VN604_05920, partial [Nitrospirota bacterium]|nr:hypothetical protein [Nitrospirota bacterium]